jgi:hypothetical protein
MSSVFENLPEVSGNGSSREFAFRSDGFGDEFPGINELLSRERLQGKPVRTCTLQIFAQDGRAVVCLSDRHRARKAFKSGESVSEALSSFEAALWDKTVEWRSDKPKYQR